MLRVGAYMHGCTPSILRDAFVANAECSNVLIAVYVR